MVFHRLVLAHLMHEPLGVAWWQPRVLNGTQHDQAQERHTAPHGTNQDLSHGTGNAVKVSLRCVQLACSAGWLTRKRMSVHPRSAGTLKSAPACTERKRGQSRALEMAHRSSNCTHLQLCVVGVLLVPLCHVIGHGGLAGRRAWQALHSQGLLVAFTQHRQKR